MEEKWCKLTVQLDDSNNVTHEACVKAVKDYIDINRTSQQGLTTVVPIHTTPKHVGGALKQQFLDSDIKNAVGTAIDYKEEDGDFFVLVQQMRSDISLPANKESLYMQYVNTDKGDVFIIRLYISSS